MAAPANDTIVVQPSARDGESFVPPTHPSHVSISLSTSRLPPDVDSDLVRRFSEKKFELDDVIRERKGIRAVSARNLAVDVMPKVEELKLRETDIKEHLLSEKEVLNLHGTSLEQGILLSAWCSMPF